MESSYRFSSGSIAFTVDTQVLEARQKCVDPVKEDNGDLYCVTVRLPPGTLTDGGGMPNQIMEEMVFEFELPYIAVEDPNAFVMQVGLLGLIGALLCCCGCGSCAWYYRRKRVMQRINELEETRLDESILQGFHNQLGPGPGGNKQLVERL